MFSNKLHNKQNISSTHIGEPLFQLLPNKETFFGQTELYLSGDSLNTAVRVKELLTENNRISDTVSLSTVLAENNMATPHIVKLLNGKGIDTSLLRYVDDGKMAVCFASTNPDGSKAFKAYGRSNSVGRLLFSLENTDEFFENLLQKTDILSTSLLTASALEDPIRSRACLIELYRNATNNGTVTVFDTNYRTGKANQWQSKEDAVDFIKEVSAHCSIILPGDEDMRELLNIKSNEQQTILSFFAECGAKTLILKNGKNGYVIATNLLRGSYDYVRSYSVQDASIKTGDSTGAGDFFNAGVISGAILNPLATLDELASLGQDSATLALKRFGAGIP